MREAVVADTLKRTRHIKCDQTKPSCRKCIRSGWKCDGYQACTTTASPPAPVLRIASYAIPFRLPGSQKDRQALHYFCVQGSRDIAGYLSSEFWSETVLQACHAESAVRQALVSLSALHLDYVTASPRDAALGDILTQHGTALRALRRRLEKPSPEATRTALVCCVLFYCFESALGNTEAAMHHLQSGLNLMSYHCGQICVHGTDVGCSEMDTLSSVFEQLDLQASIFDDNRQPVLDLTRSALIGDVQGHSVFFEMEHSYNSLTKLHNWLFHFLTKYNSFKNYKEELIPAVVLDEKQHLKYQLDKWKTQLNDFTCRSKHDSETICGIRVLSILWRVSLMLLESGFPANPSVFGASPNPQAREVVDLASSVLKATKEQTSSASATRSARRNFSSATGVVAPLFILAMKCSDEWVCDRATELLSASRRREGLYDSQAVADIVKKFRAAKEERCLAGDEMGQDLNAPLEILFADEIDRASGGMDRTADFLWQENVTSVS